ncbi:MAG: DUF3696 domain-containing protein [Cyanobacteria bacterium TGS_CYA1]|nr:DUF3696 domain-containing protein [Cyanobacteria bacterium TGS_CYA1]
MAPLTIFAGANSSGKSTVIQSMLLTAQTLQSSVSSKHVVLNGHIVRLGAFNDIVSNGHEDSLVRIGFSLRPSNRESDYSFFAGSGSIRFHRHMHEFSSMECAYSFSTRGNSQEREKFQLQPKIEDSLVRATRAEGSSVEDFEISFKRSEKTNDSRIVSLNLSDRSLSDAERASLDYELVKTPAGSARRFPNVKGKYVGVWLNHFLPTKLSFVYDEVDERCQFLLRILLAPEEFRYFALSSIETYEHLNDFSDDLRKILLPSFEMVKGESENQRRMEKFAELLHALKTDTLIAFLSAYIEKINGLHPQVRRILKQSIAEKTDEIEKTVREKMSSDYNISFVPLMEPGDEICNQVQQFFSRKLRYLGPLRDEPKSVYPLAGAIDPKDVGFRGEHTAAVLDLNKNTRVEFVASKHFRTGATATKKGTVSLLVAVLDWLKYLGVVDDVETVDRGKLGHELRVMTPETESLHDLTHVGVGVSQVLPILVLSLLAEPGSTLIFEQPELHLNPRVQTRLADFFVSLNLLGKQCIVETHSEYIINRLRYRAVLSEGKEVAENVIIYFVEKQGGHSRYSPIKINKYGVIDNWPKGFFDESEETSASILKAAMEKRKKDSAKKNV